MHPITLADLFGFKRSFFNVSCLLIPKVTCLASEMFSIVKFIRDREKLFLPSATIKNQGFLFPLKLAVPGS